MATHRLTTTQYHNVLGTVPPALHVADGDTVIAPTLDAAGFDLDNVQRARGPNPMSGPVFVEGAEPGDTLEVHIDALTPTRDTGWTRSVLATHVVDPDFAPKLPASERTTWRIERNALTLRLDKPPAGLEDLVLPFEPMIGCFGVAPPAGQAIYTATSAQNGGNMDYRGFRPGTTVWLPVAVPGALFFLGDGHAIQGDGEIVGTGVETTFDMQVTLKVRKGKAPGWPRGEDEQFIFTAGNARPLDQALQHATTEMLVWLTTDYGLDITAASHLLGQVVRYEVGNVFDPAYTMVCKVDKKWLTKRA